MPLLLRRSRSFVPVLVAPSILVSGIPFSVDLRNFPLTPCIQLSSCSEVEGPRKYFGAMAIRLRPSLPFQPWPSVLVAEKGLSANSEDFEAVV